MTRATVEQRFWSRVNKSGPLSPHRPDLGSCWVWTGSLQHQGHAQFSVQVNRVRRHYMVHRWAYEQLVGPIPDGLVLDHLCRVTCCVRPDHLDPVTPAENNRRGFSPTALNARKTHCHRGHPYAGSNVRVTAQGVRICRACAVERDRRYRLRRRVVA